MSLIQSDINRLVVGLGVTGLSTMRFLREKDLPFQALDTREKFSGIDSIQREFSDIDICLGLEKNKHMISTASEIYLSPGISIDASIFKEAVENGVKISGDIDLFARYATAPIIAITGTNGKSTVTTLVGDMAKEAGLNAGVGGNLGQPMLDLLAEDRDCYVLELSSFQLERAARFDVDVACILNLSEDHLDRHGSMIQYHQIKQSLYKAAKKIVFNRDDQLTYPLGRANVKEFSFGFRAQNRSEYGVSRESGRDCIVKGDQPLLAVDDIHLAGLHNVQNVIAALAIGEAAGFDVQAMFRAVKAFRGLPHRCEVIASVDGVRYINDSKATNESSTVAALKGLIPNVKGRLILIAGGQAKGSVFGELGRQLSAIECTVVLMGEDASVIERTLNSEKNIILFADGLKQAVQLASEQSQSGDLVLLSPACASLDMFSNYEERGCAFVEAVSSLCSEGSQ